MKGPLVPLVMIPRYTSYSGSGDFETTPIDVSAYEKAVLDYWRGKLLGGSTPTFRVHFQHSSDGQSWSDIVTATDPGQDTVQTITVTFLKKWFRVKVALTGSTPAAAVTAWMVGVLEERVES